MSSRVAALELVGLRKEFRIGWRARPFRAVDDISLRIETGEVFGLLGPNGCGKSTTIKLILGLMRPTAGSCRVFGLDAGKQEARRLLGFLPEPTRFHSHLTGEELVWLHARLSGLAQGQRLRRVEHVLELAGLGAAAQRRVAHYSTGMLRRIGLAQALVHDPRLLILDEPTAGVDPRGAEEIVAMIRRLKAVGKTVLLTSHVLGQVEDVFDRVALLDRGRVMLEGGVRELVGGSERQALVVDRLPETEHESLRVWLAERGCSLHGIEVQRRRLEELLTVKPQGGQRAGGESAGKS